MDRFTSDLVTTDNVLDVEYERDGSFVYARSTSEGVDFLPLREKWSFSVQTVSSGENDPRLSYTIEFHDPAE